MMTFVCIVVAFGAAGFLTEVAATSAAPLDYQDENDFHLGQPAPVRATTGAIENPS
jgi:hypothetical protein